ncbi:GntR family transcriptional regulator [Pseudooceanicola sediminis]|uniref:GntR family transcriptional regulator n=1 Tax=Pseudooceanicola sediminis TaxID=2211117 RepID=A0A399IXX1_9RHOB|nr:GntR family transcriptional regulator [Pseudooceanicola sediminis]KAA2312676.1 GntR family transcriptional regulator [Puniceibacterium sp. HSS470]RII37109.1 GntR family transcriptional regulator [Pseudooceanicola sediminis]|tara:strand:+ start:44277 stop:45020 length:744 start_codon:yes stop_codon:yes gene_type:complete
MAKSSPTDLLEKSNVARYIQLASVFRGRIERGDWPIGARISTVEQLAKEFGVASMTIRQALDQIEKEGLIDRFRAKGTFVRAKPERDLWCEVQTDWNGLLMSRADAQIEVLSDSPGATLLQTEFDHGTVAPSYRHLRRLHRRQDAAFLVADVYVDERLQPLIPEQNYTTTTAMRLVSDLPGVKVKDARQILSVATADVETANFLGISLNDPIVLVQRLAIDQDGSLILVANGIYRGDKVRIEMSLIE